MENITAVRPIPVLASRPTRWLASPGLLAVALAMTVPIYGGWLPGSAGKMRGKEEGSPSWMHIPTTDDACDACAAC